MGLNQSSSAVLDEVIIQGSLNRKLPSGETLLTACIQDGNYDQIAILLKRGINTNETNTQGDTPLLNSLRTRNKTLVQSIVENSGTNVNKVGRFGISPIQVAVIAGVVDSVKLLLDHGAHPDGICPGDGYNHPSNFSTPLHSCIDNKEMVQLLLQYGASVNIGCPLFAAIKKKSTNVALEIAQSPNLDIHRLLIHDDDILAAAAQLHNCELVKTLVKQGLKIRKNVIPIELQGLQISPNFKQQTGPMGYIIHFNCWECFQSLLPFVENLEQEDMNKMTMVEYALYSTGWNCYQNNRTNPFPVCDCQRHRYTRQQSNLNYRLTSTRMKYVQELLKKGADLGKVWNKAIWCNAKLPNHEYETWAMHFCIKAYHSDDNNKRTSMFRSIAFTGDIDSLSLLYLDGYNPSEEDILIVQNKLNEIRNKVKSTFEINSVFSVERIDQLRSLPRTLKNCSVVAIRKGMGPNLYKTVLELPIPQQIKNMILLEDIRGMVPELCEDVST